jgi:hypothetical protein
VIDPRVDALLVLTGVALGAPVAERAAITGGEDVALVHDAREDAGHIGELDRLRVDRRSGIRRGQVEVRIVAMRM